MDSHKAWGHKKIFLALIFALNSQMFFMSVWNPLGLKGAAEIFSAFLVLFFALYFFFQVNSFGHVNKVDLCLAICVFLLWFVAAFCAWANFNQPFIYGLLEERRILSLLIYFPLVWGLRRGRITKSDILGWVVAIGLIASVISLLVAKGIVPAINKIDFREAALRQDRYAVSQQYICYCLIVLFFYLLDRSFSARRFLFFCFVSYVLFQVIQGRQLIVATYMSMAAMVFLRNKKIIRRLPAFSFGVLCVFVLIVFFLPNFFDKYEVLFAEVITPSGIEAGSRSLAYTTVLNTILNGEIWGHGALSQMWNGGFSNVYGEYFILTDIGFMGTIFKYGVLGVIVYLAYFYIQIKLLLKRKGEEYYPVYISFFLFNLFLLPFAAPIEYRGFIVGVLLALTSVPLRDKPQGNESKFKMPESRGF